LSRKQLAVLLEDRGVVVDELFECGDPWERVHPFGAFVHRGNRDSELADERVVEFAALRQMIEGSFLVEAGHLHRPLDRFAVAIQGECAVGLTRDRHDAAIKLRSKFTVDLEFGLACGFSLVEGRIVEKRVAYRALNL
jgi:hypothetical protein